MKVLYPFPTKILAKMLRIGIPSAGESMAYSFYQLILLSFINPMGASAANAKVYYKKYTKLKHAETAMREQLAKTAAELDYIETVEEDLQ